MPNIKHKVKILCTNWHFQKDFCLFIFFNFKNKTKEEEKEKGMYFTYTYIEQAQQDGWGQSLVWLIGVELLLAVHLHLGWLAFLPGVA